MKLIVMVPALNEEATIARIVERVPRSLAGIEETEVLVINDGSTDNTALEARRAGAALVTLPVRSGLGKVFRTGLEHAMRRGADLVVTIDGDGQFDPADIPKLVSPILEGRADFVTCTRFADPEARPRMSLVKYYGNRLVTRIINWTCDTRFTDVSCGFRAFNREVVYKLTLFGNFTYTQETFIDLVSKGLRIAEVPLPVRGEREFGKSRVASNIFKYGCNSLAIILRTVRDTNPLKFFGGIGLCVGLLGAGLAAFIAGWWLRYGRTSPFTSLVPISGVLITLAFLLFVLALLADMLARHRRITEELLYLGRRRVYPKRSTGPQPAAAGEPRDPARPEVEEALPLPEGAPRAYVKRGSLKN